MSEGENPFCIAEAQRVFLSEDMFSYFVVKGQSMEPLCKEGDFILLDKLRYLVYEPKVGDIVVLRHPVQQDRFILKYIMRDMMSEYGALYWVEGLNKEESSDSRSFGWIPRNIIMGKAKIIQRPKSRQQKVIHRGSFVS